MGNFASFEKLLDEGYIQHGTSEDDLIEQYRLMVNIRHSSENGNGNNPSNESFALIASPKPYLTKLNALAINEDGRIFIYSGGGRFTDVKSIDLNDEKHWQCLDKDSFPTEKEALQNIHKTRVTLNRIDRLD